MSFMIMRRKVIVMLHCIERLHHPRGHVASPLDHKVYTMQAFMSFNLHFYSNILQHTPHEDLHCHLNQAQLPQ